LRAGVLFDGRNFLPSSWGIISFTDQQIVAISPAGAFGGRMPLLILLSVRLDAGEGRVNLTVALGNRRSQSVVFRYDGEASWKQPARLCFQCVDTEPVARFSAPTLASLSPNPARPGSLITVLGTSCGLNGTVGFGASAVPSLLSSQVR
jgi:hypothetical protein